MTFKEYILHQLREMKRELLTAMADIPDAELGSFEPARHWPPAWIAEHCTEVADGFLYATVRGKRRHEYAVQVAKWTEREPVPGDVYPPAGEIVRRWTEVCDDILGIVGELGEEELRKTYGRDPYINSVLRVINHTNSHLRSLWCILGEKRLDHKWAEQQTPFA